MSLVRSKFKRITDDFIWNNQSNWKGSFDMLLAVARDLEAKYYHAMIESQSPKLTDEQVRKMKDLYDSGMLSTNELAALFDVNPSTVKRTVNGTYHKGV